MDKNIKLLYNDQMNGSIVITTIFPPRADVYAFAKIKDWQLVAVGDKKTPHDWDVTNVVYLSPTEQELLFPKFSKILPWNIYARKNMGYLYSMKENFPIIAETDDDVSPYKNYPPDIAKNKKTIVLSGSKFVNIYNYFGGGKSWPRGFPLTYLTKQTSIKEQVKKVNAYIYNSVIDQDSDFDAIYRLISDKPVKFKRSGEYALSQGTYSPLNSQNTFFHKEAFPLLYIPSYVNPRVEDILRGYVAQRILWELDANLVFTKTTTYTNERNVHDYLKDFELELPLYLKTEKLITLLDSLSLSNDAGASLIKVYSALAKEGFVKNEEIAVVKAWVSAVEKHL
jgi:hypothetical protein